MRKLLLVLTVLCTTSLASGQKTDKKLQRQLTQLLTTHPGVAGVFVYDLKHNRVAAYNADTVFPTASMVKIPILLGVMDKIARGELSYTQELVYKDSLLYAGVDILGSFRNGEKIELGKLIMLMLTMSDNTASLWLQSLAGTGTRINAILDSLGFVHTRVNSRTPGRENDRLAYGWGQTTPREMATLMKAIVERRVISDSFSQRILRLLGRNFWDDVSISEIPADVFIASKNGAVNASRSEVLFVHGRGRRYVFCICTKNNRDQRWTRDTEAWQLARKVSALLWKEMD